MKQKNSKVYSEALSLLLTAKELGYTLEEAKEVLIKSKTLRFNKADFKIDIFNKLCTTLANQVREKKRGPKTLISLNQAYKTLCFDKKFKKLIEKAKNKKFDNDQFIKFLENIWARFSITEKVLGIIKRKKPAGIMSIIPYKEFLIIEAERIRFQLEDKNSKRRKPKQY